MNNETLFELEELIYLPINPFVKEAADLGGAEAIAGVYNIGGTALLTTLTTNPLALSFGGPVIEKVGFFAWEAIKALRKNDGTRFSSKFKQGLKQGLTNLLVDVCVHDVIYSSMMAYSLNQQVAHPVVLSAVSFLAALPPAVVVKRYGAEVLHQVLKQSCTLMGFEWEKYYEARFLVGGKRDPDQLFTELTNQLGLSEETQASYEDTYFSNRLPRFSDRLPVLRERTINPVGVHNLEIAFNLPIRLTPSRTSPHNYFFSLKEKARIGMEHTKFRSFWSTGAETKIRFRRKTRRDEELAISLDCVEDGEKQHYVLEFKVYNDQERLCQAMARLMDSESRVQITTQPKRALFKHLKYI